MPELPEVETIARELGARLHGRRIAAVELSGKPLRLGRPVDRARLEQAALGARIERVGRRAKYLVLELSTAHVVLVHLGMSGRLELVADGRPRLPHTHLVFRLDEGAELRFTDPRRFGMVVAYPRPLLASAPELRDLGPDPLDPAFSAATLLGALRQTRGCTIKAFLLDQRRLTGVGNIYASEALFLAGLHPRLRARRIGPARATRLCAALREVLEEAVRRRGTTIRDYVDGSGRPGENQHALRVFMREKAPCVRCGTPIRRLVQQARSSYFCPRCQR